MLPRWAQQAGAGLVLDTDAHSHRDLITLEFARTVVLGAGLTEDEFKAMRQRSHDLVARAGYGHPLIPDDFFGIPMSGLLGGLGRTRNAKFFPGFAGGLPFKAT